MCELTLVEGFLNLERMKKVEGSPGIFLVETTSFPVKGLPARERSTGQRIFIGPDGQILGDRSFWLETTDAGGNSVVLNGKYAAKNNIDAFFRLHAEFCSRSPKVSFSGRSLFTDPRHDGRQICIELPRCHEPGSETPESDGKERIRIPHFDEIFGRDVFLCTDHGAYKPDDSEALGITIMSMATVRAIAKRWYMTEEEVIARFRPNVIVDGEGMKAFEEFSWAGRVVTIGGISWFVSNITARCSVIQRNPFTGEDTTGFIKEFGKWVLQERFIDLAPEGFKRQDKGPNGLFCCVNTTLYGALPSNPFLENGMTVTISDAV